MFTCFEANWDCTESISCSKPCQTLPYLSRLDVLIAAAVPVSSRPSKKSMFLPEATHTKIQKERCGWDPPHRRTTVPFGRSGPEMLEDVGWRVQQRLQRWQMGALLHDALPERQLARSLGARSTALASCEDRTSLDVLLDGLSPLQGAYRGGGSGRFGRFAFLPSKLSGRKRFGRPSVGSQGFVG